MGLGRQTKVPQKSITYSLIIFLLMAISACGGDTSPELKYQPPFIPANLVVDDGGISAEGSREWITPVGKFEINLKSDLAPWEKGSIRVVVRDRKQDLADTIYEVRGGGQELSVVVDGLTRINVKDGRVLVDVTDGNVRSIQFEQLKTVAATTDSASAAWWDVPVKWNKAYATSFYRPFALTRWAYDDSTIGKGYGLGLIWFLVRLLLTVILFVVDLFLTLVFLIAQIAYLFFDSTGRNVVWGLSLFIVMIPLVFFWMAIRE